MPLPPRRSDVSRQPVSPMLLLLAALVALGSTLHGVAASAQQPAPPDVLVVMDASASMSRTDPDGTRLVDVATGVVRTLVVSLPEDARVGLRVLGHRVDDTPSQRRRGCRDTELLVASDVRAEVGVAVRREAAALEPRGRAALGAAMAAASDDLPDRGPTTVIVVSGGQDDCDDPDPCEAATALADDRDVVVDTIGVGVESGPGLDQLDCMAAAGGGEFVASTDADTLSEAAAASVRRLLARQLTATPTPAPPSDPASPSASGDSGSRGGEASGDQAGARRGDALPLAPGATHRQRVDSTRVLWFDLGTIEEGREVAVELDRAPVADDGFSDDYVLLSGEVLGADDVPFGWTRVGATNAGSAARTSLPPVRVPPTSQQQVFLRIDVTMIPVPTPQEIRVRTSLSPAPERSRDDPTPQAAGARDDAPPDRRVPWALATSGLLVLAVAAGAFARRH